MAILGTNLLDAATLQLARLFAREGQTEAALQVLQQLEPNNSPLKKLEKILRDAPDSFPAAIALLQNASRIATLDEQLFTNDALSRSDLDQARTDLAAALKEGGE